jgi:8-oxo-dGTP diphosphatase
MKQEIKVSVDAVIFRNGKADNLSVLLVKRRYEPFQHRWALPGGLVDNDESLEDAARRELKEETGLEVGTLEQLHAFGKPGRDPRNRVVSVAYFGRVNADQHVLAADTDAEEAGWFDVNQLPELAFDHNEILQMALTCLQNKEG